MLQGEGGTMTSGGLGGSNGTFGSCGGGTGTGPTTGSAGGGGASYADGLLTSSIAGNGTTPGNTGDANYSAPAGQPDNNCRVVLIY